MREIYQKFNRPIDWEYKWYVKHLKNIRHFIKPDKNILDMGCGQGMLVLALQELGYNIEGIDIFKDDYDISTATKEMWERYNLKIREHDLYSPDKQYDAIISIAVIEHQQNPFKFIQAVYNWLKPGGVAYIATPNIAHFKNRIRFLLGRPPINNLKEFKKNFCGHWREYTHKELKYLAEENGFEVLWANKNTLSKGNRILIKKKI